MKVKSPNAAKAWCLKTILAEKEKDDSKMETNNDLSKRFNASENETQLNEIPGTQTDYERGIKLRNYLRNETPQKVIPGDKINGARALGLG